MKRALLILLFAGSALSFVYIFQIYQYDFWRDGRIGRPAGPAQQILIGSVCLLILAAGIWPEPLVALSHAAAQVLGGADR